MLAAQPMPGSQSAAVLAHHDVERAARLEQERLLSLAHQASRVPVPVFLAAGFVAIAIAGHVSWLHAGVWVATVGAALLARRYCARTETAAPQIDARRGLRRMATLSLLNGIIAGSAAPLFMPALPLERQAIVTMILVCWSAGAVSVNAAYPRAFYAFTLPMLAPVATVWAVTGSADGLGVALLIALFGAIQAAFVRDNERVFRRSVEIRYDNERLLRDLERERMAVIRERDRAEEANRAKSRFLAAASHDLRQPLHTISLFSAALSMRKSDERTQELANRIGDGIASLASLLNALLDISKLDAGAVRPEPVRFALDQLVVDLAADCRPLALSRGLALNVSSTGTLVVETDPVLLEQILRNLVDNAIKYTQQGAVSITVSASAGRAVMRVGDTGPGIPQSEQERVFEEFYQLSNPERDRAQGLGLGLAIVRRMTQLLRVDLRMESEVGKGSVFELSLPLASVGTVPVAAEPTEAASEDPIPAGLYVLVVDDEASIREGMQALLEGWGCSVALAGDLEEALGLLSSQRFHLIVADYRLRGTSTGVELIRAARARAGFVPALLVSGDTAPDRLREAASNGLTLLHKPVGESDLRHHIVAALNTNS